MFDLPTIIDGVGGVDPGEVIKVEVDPGEVNKVEVDPCEVIKFCGMDPNDVRRWDG
jgi:hypothetical protein